LADASARRSDSSEGAASDAPHDWLMLDANILVKLVNIREAFSDRAHALLQDGLRRRMRLAGPPLMLIEATNAVYLQFRRKELTGDEVDQAAAQLQLLPIELQAPAGLTLRSYDFVRRHRLANVYDSHYVVLAEALGAEFWTGDLRMFNSLRSIAPWVRWIGDYPIGDADA
jgi:predicted nucleic acid-binding protein